MKRFSTETILAASRPSDIFTMNPSTLKTEAETYLSQLKPEAYKTIEHFILTQKVKSLYREAQEELSLSSSFDVLSPTLRLCSKQGKTLIFHHTTAYPSKIGMMYDAPKHVIYSVKPQYQSYFDNYIQKTKNYPVVDRDIWRTVQYMVPKVTHHFEEEHGDFIIVLEKPCKMYPLREILDYFDGKMDSVYIASILTRLYYFVCYLGLIDIYHNAITVDNLFFSPGRFVEEGENFTVEDLRIVGVFGGWFFSTYSSEQARGMPKEVLSIVPSKVQATGYSTFEVDELAIKQVGRILVGEDSQTGLQTNHSQSKDTPDSHSLPFLMKQWLTNINIHPNPYEEFHAWKKLEKDTFGPDRFIPMDISK